MTPTGKNLHLWGFTQLVLVLLPVATIAFDLTILHTNDFHDRVEEINKYAGRCTKEDSEANMCYGGSARIKTMVSQKRAEAPNNTILLSAGDQFQGTVWYYTFGGSMLARFMNLIGYDAMSLGNHEFDDGVSGLLDFANEINFPLVSSNLDLTETPSLQGLITKSTVLDVGGQQIGVVGYTTKDTSYLSRPETVTFKDELASIQAEVDVLTSRGINKIIALGHAGFHVDIELAKNLRDVDVVVGGHTNSFLYNGEPPSNDVPVGNYPYLAENPHQNQKVLVIQDYAFGKYLGELHVTFDDNGGVTAWSGNPIILDSSVGKNSDVMRIVAEYLPQLEAIRNTGIGYSHVLLDNAKPLCRTGECILGNLVTDAMVRQNLRHADDMYWTDVSIAVTNAGGLRSAISPGHISMDMILSVHPFRNVIDIIEVKGWVIRKMLEHSSSRIDKLSGAFLQMSGLQVTYDTRRPVGSRVVEVLATCTKCQVPELKPLQDNDNYKMLIPNYLKEGGDDYDFIKANIIAEHIIGDLLSQTTADYVNQTSPIFTGIQGRIRHLKDLETRDIVLKSCHSIGSGSTLKISIPILFAAIIFSFFKQ